MTQTLTCTHTHIYTHTYWHRYLRIPSCNYSFIMFNIYSCISNCFLNPVHDIRNSYNFYTLLQCFTLSFSSLFLSLFFWPVKRKLYQITCASVRGSFPPTSGCLDRIIKNGGQYLLSAILPLGVNCRIEFTNITVSYSTKLMC